MLLHQRIHVAGEELRHLPSMAGKRVKAATYTDTTCAQSRGSPHGQRDARSIKRPLHRPLLKRSTALTLTCSSCPMAQAPCLEQWHDSFSRAPEPRSCGKGLEQGHKRRAASCRCQILRRLAAHTRARCRRKGLRPDESCRGELGHEGSPWPRIVTHHHRRKARTGPLPLSVNKTRSCASRLLEQLHVRCDDLLAHVLKDLLGERRKVVTGI